MAAIIDFEAALPHQGSFEFHVHVGALAKYEGAAREAWTRGLGRHKARCRRVVIHNASPLIRMAAATVALILRLPMDFEG
jgi:hypothetical protein